MVHFNLAYLYASLNENQTSGTWKRKENAESIDDGTFEPDAMR